MPIRLKSSNSSSDQFYPLNDNVISDGTQAGGKASNSKEVRAKLTSFTKNVLKSTKNLAFDVTDQYIPNAKEVSNSFKDTVAAAKEDAKKELGGLLSFAKSHSNGASFKDTLNDLKSKGSKELKDIKERLKTGKFYMSADEQMAESLGLDDLDFGDFDFGGMDSGGNSDTYMSVTEPDTLSAEPFGGIKKGRTKTVNVSARQRQMKNKTTNMHAPRRKPSSGGSSGAMSQMRLGDELISSTTSNVGASILKKQEEIWARNYTAQEKNFGKLFGYQNQLLKGVNSIVEFNNNVLSTNVAAQMEFQGKLLAAQQDTLTSLKELKDTMMVVSTYKREEAKQSLGSKIANNPIGLDGKAYWENIKKNFGDIAAGNPLLSTLMMTPMMTDMMSMGNDTGMKLFDPMNMITKGIASAFLSKNTRNKMLDFNELLSNFGGLLTGRMNMLSRYGATSGSRMIGKLFGARTNTVSVLANTGLKDPDAVVGWTSKSDRTLNVVIPTLLAKQLAAISGKDELHYDYKSGGFKTVKSTMKEMEMKRNMAYENADTSTFKGAITDKINSGFKISNEERRTLIAKGYSKQDKNGQLSFDSSKFVDIIQKNIIKNNIMFDPQLAQYDKRYQQDLTAGIDEEYKDLAVRAFLYAYSNMNDKERARYNGAMRNVSMNLQTNLNRINDEYLRNGGENALYESGLEAHVAELKRSLTTDRDYVLTADEKNNPRSNRLRLQKQGNILARQMEIYKAEQTSQALSNKNGPSVSVAGFGSLSGMSVGSGITNVPDGLNKIFRLLLTGIPVYDQGRELPQSLLKLRSAIRVMDKEASGARLKSERYEKDFMSKQMSERAKLYAERIKFNREQRLMQYNWLSYVNPLSGSSKFANDNIINRGANAAIDTTSMLYSKVFGLGESDGSSLFGAQSYSAIDLQNTENALNAFKKRKTVLEDNIKTLSGSEKKGDKAKVAFYKKQLSLVDSLIKSSENKIKILKSDSDGSKAKSEDSKINKVLKQLESLASDASNKYIIRVRDLNDKDQKLNVGARMKNIAETINSDAVAGAELVAEAMKTKEGRASLKQTAKDKVVSTKNKIDKTSVDERAIMITMAGAELIRQEQPELSLEDAYLESATILEDTINQHKNDPNFKKAVDNYDSSVVMDKGLPRYLRFKAAMKRGLQGAKNVAKAINIGLGIIVGIPVLAAAFGVGTTAGLTAVGVKVGVDKVKELKGKVKSRKNNSSTSDNTPKIKSDTSENIDDEEASILDRMLKLTGVKDDGTTDTPVEKVEAIFKKELNSHPKLKKKWNSTKKELKKTYKKVYNKALMDGAEVYHQGKSAAEAFEVGDWKEGFSRLKGTGGAIGTLLKNGFGIIKGEVNKAKSHGLKTIDVGGNGRGFGTKLGAGIGGLGGLIFGGPLGAAAGAGGGALLGRAIGSKFGRQFTTIRGALLQQGYMDAPTMKPRDLYALVMATKGRLGNQLRSHPEFKELEARAYKPSVKEKLQDLGKGIAQKFTKTVHGAQLMIHRTFMYRNLIGLLDQTLNGNKGPGELKTNVYGMDKYMLYATINSLSTKTREQRRVKDAIMNTKEYKRLSETMRSGKGWIIQEIEDKVNNVKKGVNRLRHFKYRFFIDFLKANGHEEIEYEKDPAMIYSMLDAWGSKKKNRKTYDVIRQSKAYINLQKAVLKKGIAVDGLNLDEMKKNTSSKSARNRSRYPTLVMLINSNRSKKDPELDLSNPESIYIAMEAILSRWEKNGAKVAQANAIRRSKEFKRLCKDVGAETKASREKPENQNFLQRGFNAVKSGFGKIGRFFGFGTPDYSGAGSEAGLSKSKLKEEARLLRKQRWNRFFGIEDGPSVDEIDSMYEVKTRKTKKSKNKILTGFSTLFDKLTKAKTEKAERVAKKTDFTEIKQQMKDVAKKTGDHTAALLSGILAVNLANLKQNATDAAKKDNGGSGKFNFGDFAKKAGGILATVGAIIGSAGVITGGINGVKNKISRLKEDGITGLFTRETHTDYTADGKKKGKVQKFLDRTTDNVNHALKTRFVKSTIDAGVTAAATKGGANTVANIAKTAVKEGGKDFAMQLKEMFSKAFFGLAKNLKKKWPGAAKALQKIAPKLSDKIAKGAAENAAKTTTKAGLKNAAGAFPGIGTIIQAGVLVTDAVVSFISGYNNAGRIFKVSKNTVSGKMKSVSGLYEAIKSIIIGLPSFIPGGAGMIVSAALATMSAFLPDDELIRMIYKEVASDDEMDEWKKNQDKIKDRANKHGVDAGKLVEHSNKSFSDKMSDFFHNKAYEDKRYAKKLGLTDDEYEDFKTDFNMEERDEKSEKTSAKRTTKYDKKSKDGKFEDKYPTFAEIKNPSEAVRYFTDPKTYKALEAEAQAMFDSNDMGAIKVVFSKINDKIVGRQSKDISILNNSFRRKLKDMMSEDGWPSDLPINETKRNPFTQFAYFSKGRASNKMADDILKMAGFGGLKFWGGDNSKNTWTLNSNHLEGNAVDFNLSKLDRSTIASLGDIAKRKGIEWGGSWSNHPDLPHFEDANVQQRFATGGIVQRLGAYGKMGYVKPINHLKDFGDKMLTRLNPGEMVLNKNQQAALFNKIKRYEYDESVKGATARHPVQLSESPMVTNDRDTLVILNKALELQSKIYQEQTRHNKVSEDFFDNLMKVLGVLISNPALMNSFNKGKYKEQIDDISSDLIDGAYRNASGI